MAYDVFLFFGHGEGDPGAMGNTYKEVDLAKDLVTRINNLLVKQNVSVLTNLKNGYNNYKRNLLNGQTIKYKFGYSIHFNSGVDSARGSEILVPCKEKVLHAEHGILTDLQVLGFTNRGMKSRDYNTEQWIKRVGGSTVNYKDYYKEIRDAWNLGLSLSIIEVCFITSLSDVNLYMKNKDKVALIIANRILMELGKPIIKEEKPKATTTTTKQVFQVVTGSFSSRENAEKRIKELKAKGFDSFIQIK